MKYYIACFGLAVTTVYPISSQANTIDELMSMSLEELSMLNVDMETASKAKQKLTDIPSSVYVLSAERIQRSGVNSIAEALMLIPGLKVTKFDEASWFVSARGFHDGLYNKMLVMLDGRSLYSPIYGGTYWTDVDYILTDIERIEVLKGPGGTIWGGNAVNGVVNIITKTAQQTQSVYASFSADHNDGYQLSLRNGFALNQNVYGRVFYKNHHVKPNHNENTWSSESAGMVFQPQDPQQAWSLRVGGEKSAYTSDQYTFHYDASGDLQPTPYTVKHNKTKSYSAYIQFNHHIDINNNAYIAYSLWGEHNDDQTLDAPGRYSTIDLDATLVNQITSNHQLTIGGGLRYMHLDFSSSQIKDIDWNNPDYYRRAYNIETANDYIMNGFIQSQRAWTRDLSTTVGVKVEHFTQNNSSELSPQIRALYKLSESNSIWLGLSRAVVAPSYMDSNSLYTQVYCIDDVTCGNYIDSYGFNASLDNEYVQTAEIGYRYQDEHGLEFDLTAFASEYHNLRGHGTLTQEDQSNTRYYAELDDNFSAKSYGSELGMSYLFSEQIMTYLSYSYLTMTGTDESSATNTPTSFDIEAEHLATMQLLWSAADNLQIDLLAKYINTQYPEEWTQYPSTLALDLRVGWKPLPTWPLIEVMIENIGKHDGYQTHYYDNSISNQQSISMKVSHEF